MKFVSGHIRYSCQGHAQTRTFSLNKKDVFDEFEIIVKREEIKRGELLKVSIVPKVSEVAVHDIHIEAKFSSDKPVFNFSDAVRSLTLPVHYYYSRRDFNAHGEFIRGGRAMSLKPFESRCLFIIPKEAPAVIGSTAHLFPASEVESVELNKTEITVHQDPGIQRNNRIAVRVPGLGIYNINGLEVQSEEDFPDLWIVQAEFFEPDDK